MVASDLIVKSDVIVKKDPSPTICFFPCEMVPPHRKIRSLPYETNEESMEGNPQSARGKERKESNLGQQSNLHPSEHTYWGEWASHPRVVPVRMVVAIAALPAWRLHCGAGWSCQSHEKAWATYLRASTSPRRPRSLGTGSTNYVIPKDCLRHLVSWFRYRPT